MGPVVIYLDNCEQFFLGGKKAKSDKEGATRFKKDLHTYKNSAITKENRVLIVGTSSAPDTAELKDLKAFFDKFLYIPPPNYASRLLIWRQLLSNSIAHVYEENPALPLPQGASLLEYIQDCLNDVKVSSLAYTSEGYSGAAIAHTIEAIFTRRRVQQLSRRPVQASELLHTLATQPTITPEQRAAMTAFTRNVTGLEARVKRIRGDGAQTASSNTGKGKGKKGK
jgi:SpoVK/Ycf46/Vps4 family AAA+-type ATPase